MMDWWVNDLQSGRLCFDSSHVISNIHRGQSELQVRAVVNRVSQL